MSSYLFILGRSGPLAVSELSLLPFATSRISEGVYLAADVLESFDPAATMNMLAGTVKIAQILTAVSVVNASDIVQLLESKDKSSFSLLSLTSKITNAQVLQLATEVKHDLVTTGKHIRYMVPPDGLGTSAAVLKKEHMTEIVVADYENAFLLAEVVGVQEYAAWSQRDYGRPEADGRRGMLPPKIARMALNIASYYNKSTLDAVCDPFCGSGTVIAEAVFMGKSAVGTDISPEAISDTTQNMLWLQKQYPQQAMSHFELFVADATHLHEKIASESIGMIVTEPFMGDPKIARRIHRGDTKSTMEPIISGALRGLEKLYIGCMREWFPLLATGGVVMIAIPEYCAFGRTYSVKNLVDNCEKAGYTTQLGPLQYSREDQIVKRNFYLFQKI